MKNIKLMMLLCLVVWGVGCIETTSSEETTGQSGQSTETPPAPPIEVIPEVETPSGPGDTNTPPPVASPNTTPSENGWMIINNGAPTTKEAQLNLKLYYINENVMKISLNDNCEGGDWEPYAATKALTTFNRNQLSKVSVRFKDYDDYASPCYKDDIVHDDKGPDIIFAQSPTTVLEEGTAVDLIYDVSDSGVGMKDVSCKFNDISQACLDGRNTVKIPALSTGTYKFTITATDKLGNASEQQVTWTVSSSYRQITQNIRVNDYRKVDVLFVIDNSGSMAFEQKSMFERVRNFLAVIRGLDWQIAITTTDPNITRLSGGKTLYGDGDFIPIHGLTNTFILTSSMDEEDAQYKLGMTLQRPETGGSSEQGIFAAHRVIERASVPVAQGAQPNKFQSFIRDGAQLAVVLISDEDESANNFKNIPQNLINLVTASFGGHKRFSYHSIITVPGDEVCKSTNGATYGVRYKAMSDLTGGVIGSVCASDYAQQLESVAVGVRDLLRTLTLQCIPQVGTGTLKIEVKKDGVAYTGAYTIEGVNLKFAEVLAPADYSVKYSCLK